jgi:glycopeptide antibiotics resistance protein
LSNKDATIPLLFKQHQLWLPTLWSLLFIVTITITITIVMLTFKNMALFLAPNEPLPSRYLIVEGWVSEPSLLQALDIFKTGE